MRVQVVCVSPCPELRPVEPSDVGFDVFLESVCPPLVPLLCPLPCLPLPAWLCPLPTVLVCPPLCPSLCPPLCARGTLLLMNRIEVCASAAADLALCDPCEPALPNMPLMSLSFVPVAQGQEMSQCCLCLTYMLRWQQPASLMLSIASGRLGRLWAKGGRGYTAFQPDTEPWWGQCEHTTKGEWGGSAGWR